MPNRARANRTCSWMALSKPTCVSTWATAATSPIQDGVEGTDFGFTWIVTEGYVILVVCPPFHHSQGRGSATVPKELWAIRVSDRPVCAVLAKLSPWSGGSGSHVHESLTQPG